MTRSQLRKALLMATVLCLLPTAAAISGSARYGRAPGIGYAYPAGGKHGTTFEVKLAGRYLAGIRDVVVSGTGVKGTLVEHVKPLNGKEINLLRDRLKELQQKVNPPKPGKGKTSGGTAKPGGAAAKPSATTVKPGGAAAKPSGNPAFKPVSGMSRSEAQKEIAEIKKKLANPKNRNRENPQLGEDVTLEVTVAAGAKPGRRELRLKTAMGLSNPVAFYVGQLPEHTEKEPNNKIADAGAPLAAPLVINGQIMPGDVDHFRLKLNKGARLVMAASARELIPYIADAVPGWFQATLALYDAAGNELAYDDDYRFNPDPVLFYEVPEDGEYVIQIKDAIYRGREDFVYRIAVGELPFVTSIFPMGGRVGGRTVVTMKGWNLPTNRLMLDGKDKEPGILPVSVRRKKVISNRMPFALDTLPESVEVEPNNRLAGAVEVRLPAIVNGRIGQPGDWDMFRFEGRAGDKIAAEVYARRLGSPLDSVLKLSDVRGRKLEVNDDHEDKAAGLVTHHADSHIIATLPADGIYCLALGDAQNKGGEAYGYRLRISRPRPDFELRVVPSTINIRAGATIPITVYALREDGFSGKIELALKNAPQGWTLRGGPIFGKQDKAKLTLRVPPTAVREAITLRVEGRAEIGGRQVVRQGVPAEDMMQAFIYRHLVPTEDLKVAVLPRAKPRTPAKRSSPKTAKPAPATKPKPKQPRPD